ncbi:uncharacterized protein LOC129729840 [Wyeomyia smithii]|uniref:uncharacterized protein LOC129729840 n=1 Tax=Wyeomyia smithii TaxID=174621 RepID=UPI002467BF06|nr:uncharacterized protein LOC129729840 [Wyeomyia smithii]
MDYRHLTFTIFLICSTIAVEISNLSVLDSSNDYDLTNTAQPFTSNDDLPRLYRRKRQDIEIHRVIKRRPKLPPPIPRGRKPRPPRRPPKPKVKYGPPNVNFPPLSYYSPQNFDDTFGPVFETSFPDQNSFGEPPGSYRNPLQPSPTFGSPPFAYGHTTTSYQGSTFGKPSFDSGNFEEFGRPTNLDGYDLPKFHSSPPNFPFSKIPGFNGQSASSSFSVSRQPSYPPASSFPGSGSSSFSSSKPSSFQETSSSFLGSESNFNSQKGLSSYTSLTEVEGPKHQFPLESFNKDLYKTPLTSYEVPLTYTKQHLFEPNRNLESAFKSPPKSHLSGGISSTHSTTHSSSDGEEDDDFPSLPSRYEQDQFHNPSKSNPNKPLTSTIQTIADNDPFTNVNSYYDGESESKKVSVKTKNNQEGSTDGTLTLDELYNSSAKRTKGRRRKKPKPVIPPVGHNLDTDDLRDAYGASSDFHQVAIDADEFLEFEPQKQVKHSKPVAVAATRDEDKSPSIFVLLSAQNKNKPKNHRNSPSNHNYQKDSQSLPESDFKALDLNYFKSIETQPKHTPSNAADQDEVNILSIQKSKSKNYYAGTSNKPRFMFTEFPLTRRRTGGYYRANLDYEMLDKDDETDDVAENVAKLFGGRITNKDKTTSDSADE